MWVFLLSLGVFFAAMLLLYVIFRARADQWPPPGMPDWPLMFWASTAMLIGTSAALHWAVRCVQHDGIIMMRRSLIAGGVLAAGFVLCQIYCWNEMFRWEFAADQWRVAGFFYFLMILHAAHILGGGVALWIVLRNSYRSLYHRNHYLPVKHCAMYWHFLDVVWLVIVVAMVF